MSRRFVFILVIFFSLITISSWWWLHRFEVSTNDAYIKADILPIMSRISGRVSIINVADNAAVKQGQVIFSLDESDLIIALQQAQAGLAIQQTKLDHLSDRIKAQLAQINAAKANVNIAKIALERDQQKVDRLIQLSKKQYVAKDSLDAVVLGLDSAKAKLIQVSEQIASQQALLNVIKGEKPQLTAKVNEAKIIILKARLQLSYSKIIAPRDGVITYRQIQVGQMVAPGARLLSLVTEPLWIRANFKETKLARLKVGQAVEISIDALNDKIFYGKVVSFAAATGSEFALLPPQNATGNFTKVVQRLPVRIRFNAKQNLTAIHPGMSVVVTVDTNNINKHG
ncbi:MAG: HlyD family secretion protein [Alteromonadaceae bacterium]|nr:HlyD family secretion protein [Alteromonadaceae bacterium]